MKKLSILVASLLIFSAQAKVCDLSKGLNKDQIKTLKKAKKLKRIGPNGALLGKNVYEVDVLSNDQDEFVVILGEAHIKGPRSAIRGKKVVNDFRTRLLEGVPKAEIEYIQANNPDLSSSLGWQRVLARIITFNFFGSTITASQKDGVTFLPGYDAVLFNKKPILKERTDTAEDVIEILEGLSNKHKEEINLPLEAGEFLTPNSTDSYILDARNVRMAANIVKYMEISELKGETPLAIVGAAHNPGLVKLLKKSGLERCSNF